MSDLRQAALQALEALRSEYPAVRLYAVQALEKALAEPENQSQFQIDTKVNPAEPAQKPVAWMCPNDPDRATAFAWSYGYCIDCGKPRIPVYTAPPQRKPLTDQEIDALDNLPSYPSDAEVIAFARRIEQAHGIK